MPRFVLEKLPLHWTFVPSKRQIKALLAELGADVRLVEFYGTGFGRSNDRLSLGFVESRVVGGKWCFYLRVEGVRESAARSVMEELTATAVAEIGQYIRTRASQLPDQTVKPAQLRLSFRVEPGRVHAECRELPVGRRSFPTPVWWVGE